MTYKRYEPDFARNTEFYLVLTPTFYFKSRNLPPTYPKSSSLRMKFCLMLFPKAQTLPATYLGF